jgi:pimeloyl-ACP methyl ester carboxylesterase
MQLFHRRYGEGSPLIVLHGLFGAGGNWHTLSSRRFGVAHATYVVDLRNHGASPHSETFDLDAMAADVADFIRDHAIEPADVLGHSLGGKVGMVLALREPELVSRLVVADMSPRASPGGQESILDAMLSIDLEKVDSRSTADGMLAQTIASSPIRQFLLKNLTHASNGRYEWKLNLDVIARHYADILVEVPDGRYFGPTLFVRGSNSDYIGPEDLDYILRRFPNSRVQDVADAGHWVHADQPDAFADVVLEFLES